MKKWIKMTTFVMALLMLIGALAACAGNADVIESQAPGEADPEVSENEPADESGILKLGLWPAPDLDNEIEMHEGYLEKLRELHPNIEAIPAHYFYALDTFLPLAESGNLPTVFETWYTEPPKLIRNNLITDITNELEAKGWLDAMNPAIRNLLTQDGKIYGTPREGYALGLMLNLELFEEAGLVDSDGLPIYPKTWDEMAQTAKTIKDETGAAGFCLLAMDNAGGWHFTSLAWGFGAELLREDDGNWVSLLDEPEVIAAMQYVSDLKWKYDVLTADPLQENWGTGHVQIGTGGAAMQIAAQDAVREPTYVNGLAVDKIALVPMPKGPGGQYMLMGGTPYVFSKDASSAEISAGLDYIEIMGFAPVVSDGIEEDAKMRFESGIPVIPRFPVWTDEAYMAAVDAANEKYRNVDMRLFDAYYQAIETPGVLRPEPFMAQLMYGELTKVIQAVVTDKNADIPALLKEARINHQALLDEAQ